MTDPVETVRRGYDAIAEEYLAWSSAAGSPARDAWVERFSGALREGSAVLELGCGAGVPVTRWLARRHRVTALDISERQLELARARVPDASFVHGDMSSVTFQPASFDGVIAVHSITHVPRERHADLFARIAGWLRPNGVFVACLGATDERGEVEDDWLGAPMYFSHFDAAENRRLVRAAGLRLEGDEIVTQVEHGNDCRFLWVAARKA